MTFENGRHTKITIGISHKRGYDQSFSLYNLLTVYNQLSLPVSLKKIHCSIPGIFLVGFYVTPNLQWLYGDFPPLLVEEDLICLSLHYFRHKRAPEQNHRRDSLITILNYWAEIWEYHKGREIEVVHIKL